MAPSSSVVLFVLPLTLCRFLPYSVEVIAPPPKSRSLDNIWQR